MLRLLFVGVPTLVALCTVGYVIVTAQTMPAPRAKTELERYRIERIFEHDGCRVYRFWANENARYFASCSGGKWWPQVEVPREVKP